MSNLSLEYLPNLLVFKNENYDLVHSLPYIEQPLSKQKDHTGKSEHDKVKDVINQEMKAMDKTPESYINELPIPQTRFLDSEEMQKEFDRISKIKSDMKKHDQDIHEDISDKIPEIQLEYSSIKRLNLELMQQYEADEWDQQQNDDLIHNLEYQKSQIEKEILVKPKSKTKS
ncbi:unnamed protein product [Moneuplotes crassus]|uniref:Uncharacterized protein n=1 Tax=Euplotes crassus TaxID=5936 RepID=A0AAD1XVJ6_EUPCR|nr:unnamed protein product [Moneuplotes crassus]